MCDTWVALKNATLENRVIFAKNSDRPVDDCQPLVFKPGKHWQKGSQVEATYINLPQAETTYAHLGSKPYWCWGYESGINEWGVVIGNEAIYTKPYRENVTAYKKGVKVDPGLLGMDLIRLGLERSQTAQQAVELMGKFIEVYGQFGSGSPGKPHEVGSYDNAFIIADSNEAWTLETAGRRWAARKMTQGCTSISNEPGIRTAWNLGSPDLEAYAREKGWWSDLPWEADRQALDFAQAYIDDQTSRQASHMRVMRSQQLLEERKGKITKAWMMRMARDHYEDTFVQAPYFDAANPDFLTLCMHASPAGFTWGNTASSCVAVLPTSPEELPVFWWTPGPPCNGCYVPFFPHGSRLPEWVSRAGQMGDQVTPAHQAGKDTYSPGSYWWQFRRLNDLVKGDEVRSLPGYYPKRNPQVRSRFDELEKAFEAQTPEIIKEAARLHPQDPAGMSTLLDDFSAACVEQVRTVLDELVRGFSAE